MPVKGNAWKEFTDPSGRKYYHNGKTGETSWNKPAGFDPPKPKPVEPAPQRTDQRRRTRGARAANANAASAGVAAGVANLSVAPAPKKKPKLPPGWAEYTDDQGRVYFHNDFTKQTSWERPAPVKRTRKAPAQAPAVAQQAAPADDWDAQMAAAAAQMQGQPAEDDFEAQMAAAQAQMLAAQGGGDAPAVWRPDESSDDDDDDGQAAVWSPDDEDQEVEEEDAAPAVWKPEPDPPAAAPAPATMLPSTHASAVVPTQGAATVAPGQAQTGANQPYTGSWGAAASMNVDISTRPKVNTRGEVDDDIGGVPHLCALNVGEKGAGLRFIYEKEGWWIFEIADVPGQPELQEQDLVVAAGAECISGLEQKQQVAIIKENFAHGSIFSIRRGMAMPDGFMNESNQFVYLTPGHLVYRIIPGLGRRPATRYVRVFGMNKKTPWPLLRRMFTRPPPGYPPIGKPTRTTPLRRPKNKKQYDAKGKRPVPVMGFSGECIVEFCSHNLAYQVLTKYQDIELDGKLLRFDVAEAPPQPRNSMHASILNQGKTDIEKLQQLEQVAKFLIKKMQGSGDGGACTSRALDPQLRFKFTQNRGDIETDVFFMDQAQFWTWRPEFELLRDPHAEVETADGTTQPLHGLMEHNHNGYIVRLKPEFGGNLGAPIKHKHSNFAGALSTRDMGRSRWGNVPRRDRAGGGAIGMPRDIRKGKQIGMGHLMDIGAPTKDLS